MLTTLALFAALAALYAATQKPSSKSSKSLFVASSNGSRKFALADAKRILSDLNQLIPTAVVDPTTSVAMPRVVELSRPPTTVKTLDSALSWPYYDAVHGATEAERKAAGDRVLLASDYWFDRTDAKRFLRLVEKGQENTVPKYAVLAENISEFADLVRQCTAAPAPKAEGVKESYSSIDPSGVPGFKWPDSVPGSVPGWSVPFDPFKPAVPPVVPGAPPVVPGAPPVTPPIPGYGVPPTVPGAPPIYGVPGSSIPGMYGLPPMGG